MGDQVGQSPTAEPSVCAVVITCDPDPGWAERFDAIARQAPRVVVVDDHSGPPALKMIAAAVARRGGQFLGNDAKRGHAGVLNQGAGWVFSHGFRWALIFDDDTLPRPGIASELLDIHRRASAIRPIGMVGSNYYDDKQGALRYRFDEGKTDGWTPRATVILSGSLLERDAFAAIGPFREEFFVASIDHDFCLRARAKGFEVLISTRPLMTHSIGATSVHRLAGLSIATTNHTAKRRYYMARNHVTLLREHVLGEPRWVAQGCYALLRDAVAVMLFERDRTAKVRSMAVGAWHGLRGKLGRGPGDAR